MAGKIEFKSTTSHCSKTPDKGQSQRQATLTEKALKQKAMHIAVCAETAETEGSLTPCTAKQKLCVCFQNQPQLAPGRGLWSATGSTQLTLTLPGNGL